MLPALVALALLLLPGFVPLVLIGLRPTVAAAASPALSTGIVVAAGSVAAALDRPWTATMLLLGTGLAWLVAAAAWFGLRAARARWWPGTQGDRSLSSTAGPEREGPAWASATALLLGTLAAASIVAFVLTRSADSPEEFPQHPDTIFHLGVTQWMAENRDISYQHGTTFARGPVTSGYPIGLHSMAASVALFTDVPAVVAVSAIVLVTAGVIWPLGVGVVARIAFGGAVVAGVGAVTSVLFVAFPFMLMGFGVLWANLYGQALLPGVLALGLTVTAGLAPNLGSTDPVGRGFLAAAICLPGLALAHPQAVITGILFLAAAALVAAARRARAPVGTPWRRLPVTVISSALVVGVVASLIITPGSMKATGAPGPEMSVHDALQDVAGFAPRVATPAYLLGVTVLVGCLAIVLWFRSALWVLLGLTVLVTAYYLNTAVDTPTARLLTWPWYNNAIRIAAVGVLPAALTATAAILGPARLVGRHRSPGWAWEGAVAAAVVAALVIPPSAWVRRDVKWLRPYFHPGVARSWANPEELAALHELAAQLPDDAVVAADPWKGGTYMYVVGGTTMLWPTEKANTTPSLRLLGLRLDRVGDEPAVCQAALDQGVTHALTGGVPFLWGGSRSRRQYVGVARVSNSPAWRELSAAGPYRLFEMVDCADRPGG
ncbi:hypothetical protein GCM10023168_03930 [Fodinibacter luteus]|uniref:Uncharacterized protein n=2 Tax=Fodinibacter luteus TaxID=552064 RepID=A0ABP8JZ66_9MICO